MLVNSSSKEKQLYTSFLDGKISKYYYYFILLYLMLHNLKKPAGATTP